MPHQLTLKAPVERVLAIRPPAPPGFLIRPSAVSDAGDLGRLYFEAYEPGVAATTAEAARADIDASFEGAYGDLWFEASPVAEREARLVAAVMTVRRAPWNDVPDCPFVIELLTERNFRRLGLAQHLMVVACSTLADGGESEIALRVSDDNTAATRLYEKLGFTVI